MCRPPVACARLSLKFEECHLPTLLAFTASPRCRNLHTRKSQAPPATLLPTKKDPKPVPAWAAFISPRPGHGFWRLCAAPYFPRSVHKNAQTKNPLHVQKSGITLTNHCRLEEIGFEPQNCAQPAAGNKIPKKIKISGLRSPRPEPQRMHKNAQTKTAATCRSPDNSIKRKPLIGNWLPSAKLGLNSQEVGHSLQPFRESYLTAFAGMPPTIGREVLIGRRHHAEGDIRRSLPVDLRKRGECGSRWSPG